VEFSSDKSLDFFCSRGGYICKPIQSRIDQAAGRILRAVGTRNNLLRLSDDKCKSECEFVVIVKFEDEIRVGR
jgi:hypothetical protein